MNKPFTRINSRTLTCFSDLQHELTFEPNKNYLFDLSYLTAIHIVGERSQEFLQGQITCNVLEVNPSHMQQGALCTIQGRVLALLDIIDWHGFHLILPTDLCEMTETSLAKTARLSRVDLSHSSSIQVLGFHLKNATDLIPFDMELPKHRFDVVTHHDVCCYALDHDFYLFLIKQTPLDALINPFINTQQWRGSLAWHALQLQQQHINIYPESRGLFLPQRLNLHQSGHISFNKGCYKGQEIIARMHYRSKQKHELVQLIIPTQKTLQSGQKIMSQNENTELGELIDYCPIDDHNTLIIASILIDRPSMGYLETHPIPLN